MARNSRLNSLPPSWKVLITGFLLALMIGHAVAVLQVHSRTGLDRAKTILYFRGNEADPDSLQVPQSYGSLVAIAHVHSFSQPMMLALVGFLFVLTGASEKTKILIILVGLTGSLGHNAGPFLIRYVSAAWVILIELSGVAMLGSFIVMFVRILRDVWVKER